MNVASLPEELPGFEVNLENVAVWVIREMRLHGSLPDDIVLNLKVDGRPFFGNCSTWLLIFMLFAIF